MASARTLLVVSLLAALGGAAPLAAQEPLSAGSDGVPVPKKTKHVQPTYPAEALAQGIRGIVILDVVVGTTGKVESTSLVRSVPGLDEAAIAAATQWEYEPVKVDGKPVAVRLTVPITFALALPKLARDTGIPELRQGASPVWPAGGGEAGAAVAEVSLEPDGRIGSARITSGDEPWSSALLAALRTWRFPPPDEDAVVSFRVSADFVGGKPDQRRVDLKASGLRKADLLAAAQPGGAGAGAAPAGAGPSGSPASAVPVPGSAPAASHPAQTAPAAEPASAQPPTTMSPAPTTAAPANPEPAPPTAAPEAPKTPASSGSAPSGASPAPASGGTPGRAGSGSAATPAPQPPDPTPPTQKAPPSSQPSPANPPAGAPAPPGSTPDAAPPVTTPPVAAPPPGRAPAGGSAGAPPVAAPVVPRSTAPATAKAPGGDRTAPPPVEVITAPAPPPVPENGVSAVRDVMLAPGVPDLTRGRRPVSPPLARMSGTTGTVEVAFSVSAAGGTTVQTVVGPEPLRRAAQEAVGSWVFRRARADRAYLLAVFNYAEEKTTAEIRPQPAPEQPAAGGGPAAAAPAQPAPATPADVAPTSPATGPGTVPQPTQPPVMTPPTPTRPQPLPPGSASTTP